MESKPPPPMAEPPTAPRRAATGCSGAGVHAGQAAENKTTNAATDDTCDGVEDGTERKVLQKSASDVSTHAVNDHTDQKVHDIHDNSPVLDKETGEFHQSPQEDDLYKIKNKIKKILDSL